jgi:3',5'-nucleoside bisphosphate phosphatase
MIISAVFTTWHRKPIHFTVYDFDWDNERFIDMLTKNGEIRKEVFVKKVEAIAPDKVAEFIEYSGSFFNTNKTREFLLKTGRFADLGAVRQAMRAVATKEEFLSPKEAIEVAHQAGGVIVLAHPLAPMISLKQIEATAAGQRKLAKELAASGLDGIECYQAGHESEDVALALEIAKENNLLVSCGSDWHGPIKTLGESIRDYIPHYVEAPGDLKTPISSVAPLLERLGVVVDKK